MSATTAQLVLRHLAGEPGSGGEPTRRRYRRVMLSLPGRFMRADKTEHDCQLVDISVGGASVKGAVAVESGERIVVYFEHLGSLEGVVVRAFPAGFALRSSLSAHKRERLAAKLTWLINRSDLENFEAREEERVRRSGNTALLRLEDGREIECELLDMSVSGASLATTWRPPLGSIVTVGKQSATVRRHHRTGIGIEFGSQ